MKAGDRVKHIKTGKKYTIIAIANENATKEGWPVTVVYRDDSGNVWCRCLPEFERRTVLVGVGFAL